MKQNRLKRKEIERRIECVITSLKSSSEVSIRNWKIDVQLIESLLKDNQYEVNSAFAVLREILISESENGKFLGKKEMQVLQTKYGNRFEVEVLQDVYFQCGFDMSLVEKHLEALSVSESSQQEKLNQLKILFPNLSDDILLEVLFSQENNLPKTEEILHSFHEDNDHIIEVLECVFENMIRKKEIESVLESQLQLDYRHSDLTLHRAMNEVLAHLNSQYFNDEFSERDVAILQLEDYIISAGYSLQSYPKESLVSALERQQWSIELAFDMLVSSSLENFLAEEGEKQLQACRNSSTTFSYASVLKANLPDTDSNESQRSLSEYTSELDGMENVLKGGGVLAGTEREKDYKVKEVIRKEDRNGEGKEKEEYALFVGAASYEQDHFFRKQAEEEGRKMRKVFQSAAVLHQCGRADVVKDLAAKGYSFQMAMKRAHARASLMAIKYLYCLCLYFEYACSLQCFLDGEIATLKSNWMSR